MAFSLRIWVLVSVYLWTCCSESSVGADEASESPFFNSLITESKVIHPWLQNIRRNIHKHPELGFEEHKTAELITKELREMGIPERKGVNAFSSGWGVNTFRNNTKKGTGIVVDIGTGNPPCVALRADMDAIPIKEETPISFRSIEDGKMHACGHDVHVTMLLGAVHLLWKRKDSLKGTVRLIFQPAEEVGLGAHMMIQEGVLSMKPSVQKIYGFHVNPFMPTGQISTREGPLLAGKNDFVIKVVGKGGHAGFPAEALDPIYAASAIVQNMYGIASRDFSGPEKAHITVTGFKAGNDAKNVIPSEAVLRGTERALSFNALMGIKKRMNDVAKNIADAHKCTLSVEEDLIPVPPVENNKETTDFVYKHAAEGSRDRKVSTIPPVMGAEDFAFYTQQIPGTFVFLGTGSGGEKSGHVATDISLHSSMFAVDEEILPLGSALHAQLALRTLDEPNSADTEVKQEL